MEGASYIQWNVPNWITIFLMATIGYLAVGFISAAAKNIMSGQQAA